jgi:hypothetical protein
MSFFEKHFLKRREYRYLYSFSFSHKTLLESFVETKFQSVRECESEETRGIAPRVAL